MGLKLMIADDEQLICNLLENIIDFQGLGLQLIATAHDGETLLQNIIVYQPDIVITDIYMPKRNGIEVIGEAQQRGVQCKFIVISGYRQFDYAYNALKYGVKDYLLKPIDPKELHQTLQNLVDELAQSAAPAGPAVSPAAVRNAFFNRLMHELHLGHAAIDSINRDYGFAFAPGLFRILFIKLDYSSLFADMENGSSLFGKIESLLTQHLAAHCTEMVQYYLNDGMVVVVNYQGDILPHLRDLTTAAGGVVDLFDQMTITVGASSEGKDINRLSALREEAFAAIWARMVLGCGKLICYDRIPQGISPQEERHIDTLCRAIKTASKDLDADGFAAQAEALFSQPPRLLAQPFMRRAVRDLQTAFFEINGESIQRYTHAENLRYEINYVLHMVDTIEKYRQVFIQKYTALIRQLVENNAQQSNKPVRDAIAYIQAHFREPINLNVVAEQVHLSSVYFSHMFKKETGENFTDYVTGFRMEKAKEYLKSNHLNINEISVELGYADTRYFSKLFKRVVGVKPSDYRNLYG